MKKILFVMITELNYKAGLLNVLSQSFDVHLAVGQKSHIHGLKEPDERKYSIHRLNNLYFGKFLYQKGLFRIIRSGKFDSIIFLGVNPAIISTLIAAIYLKYLAREVKFFWWGHGTSGGQGFIGRFIRKMFYSLSEATFLYSHQNSSSSLLKNFIVLGNPVPDEWWNGLSFQSRSTDLIYIGRLVPQRSIVQDIMILDQALRLINKRCRLTIVGKGELERKKIEKLYLKSLQIEFLGEIYGKDLSECLGNNRIIWTPHGIGLTANLAYNAGLRVLTVNDFSIHKPEIEYLMNYSGAAFYSKYSAQDLARCYERLTVVSPEKYKSSLPSTCIESALVFNQVLG